MEWRLRPVSCQSLHVPCDLCCHGQARQCLMAFASRIDACSPSSRSVRLLRAGAGLRTQLGATTQSWSVAQDDPLDDGHNTERNRDMATREYQFLQVDVFTDTIFGGNPLAVFPEAGGLTTAEMQSLAREMNLSETTFVLPPESPGADFRVRIFTPAAELPFAGHPVVGTHWVLAHLGLLDLSQPVTTVHLELGVGLLPADLHVRDGSVRRVVMTQDRPTFHAILSDVSDLATGLGLTPGAIAETGLPVQVVSTGMPQMMVPVRSLNEVRGLEARALRLEVLNRVCQAVGSNCVLVFALETERPEATVHVRMFAPLLGILEDPATGSANGALAAYLVCHRAVPLNETTVHIVAEQGVEIGRPSTLFLEVDHDDGAPTAVRVGGEVVLIAEGVVQL
jgi:trans-2,3-dihydro-3-hydroxyanthranilate isomerase